MMRTVLIVEDEHAMLEIFAELAEEAGHRTLRAHNGEEALQLARSEPPDLVVSDHMMPRLTGLELLREMRADPKLAAIPFVLLSAARPEGLEAADVFVPKPIDLDTFESTIEAALSLAPAAGPPAQGLAIAPPCGTMRDEMLNWVAHGSGRR
jgi:two-component system, sensor histidine kinase and response regulator